MQLVHNEGADHVYRMLISLWEEYDSDGLLSVVLEEVVDSISEDGRLLFRLDSDPNLTKVVYHATERISGQQFKFTVTKEIVHV